MPYCCELKHNLCAPILIKVELEGKLPGNISNVSSPNSRLEIWEWMEWLTHLVQCRLRSLTERVFE